MQSTWPRVVISHRVDPEVVALLATACEVVANDASEALPPDELLRRCRDASALIAFMTDRIDEAFLTACPRLQIIAGVLKGYDNIDVAACTRHGVSLTVAPDLLTAPTAELTIGLMIGLARNVAAGDRLIRSGRFRGWQPILYGRGIQGSTIGLIGAGAIGQAIARRLAAFGACLLYFDRTRLSPGTERELELAFVSMDELLSCSDFVILCVPLSPGTRCLVDAGFLARMKTDAFLINPARGSLVDEEAVADALAAGTLGGYAADVFAMEDLAQPDRPNEIPPRLREATSTTLFTPHLGSAVAEARRAIAFQAATSVLECFAGGMPPHAVNRPPTPRQAVSI